MLIRRAEEMDIGAMARIAELCREKLEVWQPIFWRRASGSAELSESFFRFLMQSDDNCALVNEDYVGVDGFLIATIVDASPVFNPGGKICLIDDFAVAEDGLWGTVGEALVERASKWAKSKGATQTVVIAPLAYEAKLSFLKNRDMTPAASWWVKQL